MVLAFASGRVAGEYKVTSFDRVVEGEAGFKRGNRVRLAVFELSETPASRCGIFLRVLDHKLNVRGIPSHKRLGTAKNLVVFL